MTLELIYALVSALMLAFIAASWSTKDLTNIVIKVGFVAAAFAGAIVVARALSL